MAAAVPPQTCQGQPIAREPPDEALRLGADDVAFIQSSVSVMAAAEGPDRRPAMARAIAAIAEPESGRVRLCLRTQDAAALIAGAAANGTVAVMFSRPQTNQTIQLKGNRVAIEPLTSADDAARRRYLPMMIAELMPLGFDATLIGCIMSDDGSPLAVLSFMPTALFDQTPGPGAGKRRPCERPAG